MIVVRLSFTWLVSLISIASLLTLALSAQGQDSLQGQWDASLSSPGGDLRFGVLVESSEDVLNAYFLNGPEKIKIPKVNLDGNTLTLEIPHYDSRLVLERSEASGTFQGFWQKTRGKDNAPKMKAKMARHQSEKHEQTAPFLGKWSVDFSGSDDPSIAIIQAVEGSATECWATFRTTTGDYRFLSGTVRNGKLELSVFDGAHAFLFIASINQKGQLEGDFWSSLNWHETWTAVKDEAATMPNAFAETTWKGDTKLADFKFPNLDGVPTSLNDPAFVGRPRLIHVFGSWCPNCHDAGIYLGDLQAKYGKDLSVLGLAFELTGDFQRDAEQVRVFHRRHKTDYPTLIAGLSDKKLATEAIPFLDRVRSYPTTIFLDAEGEVVGIHTGFNGPATGGAYQELKQEFESRIDAMIKKWKSQK